MANRFYNDIYEILQAKGCKGLPVRVSRLSYGLPAGGSIGFADRVTLHMAMEARKEMNGSAE